MLKTLASHDKASVADVNGMEVVVVRRRAAVQGHVVLDLAQKALERRGLDVERVGEARLREHMSRLRQSQKKKGQQEQSVKQIS